MTSNAAEATSHTSSPYLRASGPYRTAVYRIGSAASRSPRQAPGPATCERIKRARSPSGLSNPWLAEPAGPASWSLSVGEVCSVTVAPPVSRSVTCSASGRRSWRHGKACRKAVLRFCRLLDATRGIAKVRLVGQEGGGRTTVKDRCHSLPECGRRCESKSLMMRSGSTQPMTFAAGSTDVVTAINAAADAKATG